MELTSINMKSALTFAIAQTVWYWVFLWMKNGQISIQVIQPHRNLIILNLFFLNSRFFSAHINPRWVLLKGLYPLKPCSTLLLVLKQTQISFWLYCLLHWLQFFFFFKSYWVMLMLIPIFGWLTSNRKKKSLWYPTFF